MNLSDITPVILTRNEEPNLPRVLARLRWAREVVLVDSESTDATTAIAAAAGNVRVLARRFDDHTTQWNYGVDAASTLWVLAMDADYVLGEGFEAELESMQPSEALDAWYAAFRYCIGGVALRGTLYPPRAVLFRKDRCRYIQDGHTQLLNVQPGRSAQLQTKIDHDDRKPLSRWLVSQDNYAKLEAEKLTSPASHEPLRLQDKLRRGMVLAPWLTLFYCLFARGLIFDGWRGWYYTLQRVLAELVLSLRLVEKRLSQTAPASEETAR